jgi:hypothetical protein
MNIRYYCKTKCVCLPVCQADAHSGYLLFRHFDQTLHLAANESHQILHAVVADAIDIELFLQIAKIEIFAFVGI